TARWGGSTPGRTRSSSRCATGSRSPGRCPRSCTRSSRPVGTSPRCWPERRPTWSARPMRGTCCRPRTTRRSPRCGGSWPRTAPASRCARVDVPGSPTRPTTTCSPSATWRSSTASPGSEPAAAAGGGPVGRTTMDPMTSSAGTSREATGGGHRSAPVGHAAMRSANLSLLLRHLHTRGGRSRATLAQETGLSKAAVTSLIHDLAERGLVPEVGVELGGTVGRPGTEVRLAAQPGAGIGLELNVDYLAVCLRDLTGEVRFTSSVPMPYVVDETAADGSSADGPASDQPESDGSVADGRSYPPGLVLDGVAEQLTAALRAAAGEGLWIAGITIAPPGPIDYEGATVRFASNLGWADVPLGAELAARLGPEHPPLALENDAKRSALAEAPRLARRGITDLVYVTGDMGVGAGIIA